MTFAFWTQDRLTALGLFALAFGLLLVGEPQVGFTRDESVYFAAAESHARWFQLLLAQPGAALSDAAIVQGFDYNHEHPGLMKSLFGLSWLVFSEWLHLVRPATGFRLPALAVGAAVLPLVYVLARERFGRVAGVFAALSFLLVPNHFFHSILACFDVPVALMWLLVVFCFWRGVERPFWWLWTGVAFGAALATKHNAFFVPVVLIPFSLYLGWQRSAGKPQARSLFLAINGVFVALAVLYAVLVLALGPAGFQASFLLVSPQVGLYMVAAGAGVVLARRLRAVDEDVFRAVAPLVSMATVSLLVFYLCWPYLWHHPVDRTAWWTSFHATHNHYAWLYLGQLLRGPPFPLDYVVVKTALTVPTSLFVPMVLGLSFTVVRLARRQGTWVDALLVVNALASIAIISHPQVPHFGGVKHWFPSMPFLAVLAGGAVQRGAQALDEVLRGRGLKAPGWLVPAGVVALALAPAAWATRQLYPYGTSAYSELAGGLPGAATLGMQRQFWANNVTGVLPWLNANLRPGERVYFHECHGGQLRDYQRNGMLRPDIGLAGSPFDADVVAYQYHQEFREHEIITWQALGTTRPVTGLYLDETPQLVVYRRR